MKNKRILIIPISAFLIGLTIRVIHIYPANTIIGFDQIRDFFGSLSMVKDHHLKIIGATAGNNPNLHHGVLFLYYILPPLLIFNGNPIGIALTNSVFNALSGIIVYFFAKNFFEDEWTSVIATIIAAVSFELIQFSGWISNPTFTITTTPLFFFGVWLYYKKKNYGLYLAALALGLSIEFELFFIYLIPIALILFLALKLRIPNFKTLILSTLIFTFSVSTMVATELKFHFSGVKSILGAGSVVGQQEPIIQRLINYPKNFQRFSLMLWPQHLEFGVYIGFAITFFLLFQLTKNFKNKKERDKFIFLIVYLYSPLIMLLLGEHNAPWFLIGRPGAVILTSSYVISKIRPKILGAALLLFIASNNLMATKDTLDKGQVLLEPDTSALMSKQLKVIDYTYQKANKLPFSISSVTNPLYINAVWSYHYDWYGRQNYNYLPTWHGGDQIAPYNTLQNEDGNEKIIFLIMDDTGRIPDVYRKNAEDDLDKSTKIIEVKDFDGIKVEEREKLK